MVLECQILIGQIAKCGLKIEVDVKAILQVLCQQTPKPFKEQTITGVDFSDPFMEQEKQRPVKIVWTLIGNLLK